MSSQPPVLGDLLDFIDSAPSPYHAAEAAAARLRQAGLEQVDLSDSWTDRQNGVVVTGGSVVAWRVAPGVDPSQMAFRLIGAHTDSPNLRVKPRPDTGAVGYRQLGVEVYGGALLNSWLDRDLGLSGRIAVSGPDGLRTELLRVDQPLLRVAQLAIHLDRDVNDKGVVLDRQRHLAPLWGLGSCSEGDFRTWLADRLDVEPAAIDAWDLMLHDLTPSSPLGVDNEMYAAPRIDNLASCHAATEALATSPEPSANTIAVVVLFDHEEIGSESATGAASALLLHALERVAGAVGADRDQFLRALTRSWCVSSDGAHAVHPNYTDRYEPEHRVVLNGGPVIKVNANVRYASDAETTQRFQSACRSAGVPFQLYSHRTNLACGSTIGPITAARLGIRVVDVGSAQLSMHSARELGGSEDPSFLTRALGSFLSEV